MLRLTPEIFNPVGTKRPYTTPLQRLIPGEDGLLVDNQIILTARPHHHGGKAELGIFARQGITIFKANILLKTLRFQEADGADIKSITLRISPVFPSNTVYIGNALLFRCTHTDSRLILCELDSTHPVDIQTVSRDENFLTYLKRLRRPYGQRN